jgi:hypothetical protein
VAGLLGACEAEEAVKCELVVYRGGQVASTDTASADGGETCSAALYEGDSVGPQPAFSARMKVLTDSVGPQPGDGAAWSQTVDSVRLSVKPELQ